VQTHTIGSQKIRGVLRDPKHGCPHGCFEMIGTSGTGAFKESLVGDSTNDVEDETETIFAKAQKLNRMPTKEAASLADPDAVTNQKRRTKTQTCHIEIPKRRTRPEQCPTTAAQQNSTAKTQTAEHTTQQTTKATSKDANGVVTTALRLGIAAIDPAAESSDDEDILTSLWGKRVLNCDDGNATSCKKARRTTLRRLRKQNKTKAAP